MPYDTEFCIVVCPSDKWISFESYMAKGKEIVVCTILEVFSVQKKSMEKCLDLQSPLSVFTCYKDGIICIYFAAKGEIINGGPTVEALKTGTGCRLTLKAGRIK